MSLCDWFILMKSINLINDWVSGLDQKTLPNSGIVHWAANCIWPPLSCSSQLMCNCACTLVCVPVSERVCVHVCMCLCVCLCVCMCVWERGRERERVRECPCLWVMWLLGKCPTVYDVKSCQPATNACLLRLFFAQWVLSRHTDTDGCVSCTVPLSVTTPTHPPRATSQWLDPLCRCPLQ